MLCCTRLIYSKLLWKCQMPAHSASSGITVRGIDYLCNLAVCKYLGSWVQEWLPQDMCISVIMGQ